MKRHAYTLAGAVASTASGSNWQQKGRTPQLAWLTDDMLKPSTRSAGIAVRLK